MNKMKKNAKVGIWMDHSNAYIMEYENASIVSSNILSEMNHKENEEKWVGHEKHIHTKEKSQLASFYKKIGDRILDYKEVVLFGLTEAEMHKFIIDYFG